MLFVLLISFSNARTDRFVWLVFIPCSRENIGDCSQTLVWGAWCKKNVTAKMFWTSPFHTSKNFSLHPLFAMKITGQPHRKVCKLSFYWKICVFFQALPLPRFENFKGPLLASSPPPPSVCEWSLANSAFDPLWMIAHFTSTMVS